MKHRTFVFVIILVILASLFAFVPMVHVTNDGYVGSLIINYPAYESLSCVVFGLGTGYWPVHIYSLQPQVLGQWTYNLRCPPNLHFTE